MKSIKKNKRKNQIDQQDYETKEMQQTGKGSWLKLKRTSVGQNPKVYFNLE